MSWLQHNQRAAAVVGITLAVPLLLVVYSVAKLVTLGSAYEAQIDSLEPRVARLIGARQAQEQLLNAANKAQARVLDLVYPASADTDSVAAAMQTDVRGILAGAGLVVVDSRIEAAKREGALDLIGLTVSVSGSIDALDLALTEVAAYTPLLLITDINMAPARAARRSAGNGSEQRLNVKIHFLALRNVE